MDNKTNFLELRDSLLAEKDPETLFRRILSLSRQEICDLTVIDKDDVLAHYITSTIKNNNELANKLRAEVKQNEG